MSNNMLIDSHCHLDMLDLSSYNGSLDAAIKKANENDVAYFLSAGVTLEESRQMLELAKKNSNIVISVGAHPGERIEDKVEIEEIISVADSPYVVAIGETGLDFYNKHGEISIEIRNLQKDRFRKHIIAAMELNKPLVIHSRASGHETLQILEEENAKNVGAVFHCFTDAYEIAEKAISMGFYIGVPGIVTFKNAKELQKIVTTLPLNRILLETDSPYLAPEPHRGKPNEPAYLFYIAEYVAKLKGVSYEVVAKQTTENFFNLFHSAKNIFG